MKTIDRRFQYEEQIFMQREVANIKARMLQMVQHARSGQMNQMEAVMANAQFRQLAQHVLMIRQRCQHVWNAEYVFEELKHHHTEEFCVICEARRILSSSE